MMSSGITCRVAMSLAMVGARRAVRRNFAAAQLGELVHVVDGAGDVRITEYVAARVGYGAGDGGTAKGSRARRPGLNDCRMRCSASRRMLASGGAGAHSPAATGGSRR